MMGEQTRRQLLHLLASAGTISIAGCSDSANDEPTREREQDDEPTSDREQEESPTPTEAGPSDGDFGVDQVEISETEITKGDTIEVTTVVRNQEDSIDEFEINLYVDDDTVDTKTVEIEEGANETIRFSKTVERVGRFNVYVEDKFAGEILVDPETVDNIRDVAAHYYIWYQSRWHDYPDGEWSLESPSTPILGDYSSGDPNVHKQHIEWCHTAGINWLNVSWWGPAEENITYDEWFQNLLDHPRGHELEYSILYETDGRLGVPPDMDSEENRRQFRQDLEHFAAKYFNRESYKTIDGRPVLYIFRADSFYGDVETAFEEAFDAAGVEPYIIADMPPDTAIDYWPMSDLADAVTIYAPVSAFFPYRGQENLDEIFLENLEEFYQRWYLVEDLVDVDIMPTVMPGWNTSEITHAGGPPDHPTLDPTPELFERAAKIARKYAEGPVFITSFNEWYENTQIEPSEEFGEEFLDVSADILATGERTPPTINGEQLVLSFEKVFRADELNPDASPPHRSMSFLCHHISIYDEAGAKVSDIDVGGDEGDALFLFGMHGKTSGDRTRRWLGSEAGTGLHLPDIPDSGTIDLDGWAPEESGVKIIINGEVRGEGTVGTDHGIYTIEYS